MLRSFTRNENLAHAEPEISLIRVDVNRLNRDYALFSLNNGHLSA